MNEIVRLEHLIAGLRDTSSQCLKKQILKNYPDLKPLLKIIYDPLYSLNITSDRIINFYGYTNFLEEYGMACDLYMLLDQLHRKIITGNKASLACLSFINYHLNENNLTETFFKIIDKDLKCGISTKTINSVFPKLIPEFNVPLAQDYNDGLCDFRSESWYASRKLDGVRCLCFITNKGQDIHFFSRKGIEYETLNNLIEPVKNFYINTSGQPDIILDGEICLMDENGNENFQAIMTEIRRKNHTIKKPKFFVFGHYSIYDFKKREIIEAITLTYKNNDCVQLLQQTLIKDDKHLNELIDNIPNEWEGLILKHPPTKFKRSKNLLKIKKFKDAEFVVTGTLSTDKFIDGSIQKCVGSLIVAFKKNSVYVGSGLTDYQRLFWFKNPTEIIGKTITVKYFNESLNKEGKHSLKWPIFKGIRND
jgi:DNA ligase 1